jgi:protein-S-isoprenylcysteine O-methyltransferase Ste14
MNAFADRVIRYRPPRIAMLFVLLAAAMHWLLPSLRVHLFSSPVLAVVAVAGGFAVMMWAWWLFQKAETAICPTEDSQALVTTGIFRVTRHPMYLGMVLMVGGVAFWFGTVPWYLATTAFFLVINQVFCPYEERALTATFGDEYTDYKRRVRRWI